MHSATNEAQFPAIQPSSTPPFSSRELFVVLKVSFFLSQSHFSSSRLDHGLREKGLLAPCLLLVLYLQQPNKMESRTPHSPSSWGWGYLLFCFFGGHGGCHLAFAKGPKNSGEESASCYQLLSLVRAATPLAGKQGVYWAMPLNGNSLFALTQQCQGFN